MVVTSICDPSLFDQPLLEDRNYVSCLSMILQKMAQNHLPVIDSNGNISKAILEKLSLTPKNKPDPEIQKNYSALLQPERIVRVPVDLNRIQRLGEWIGTDPATAVSCSENPLVDVLLASDDTLIAMEEENIDKRKTTLLQEFHKSCWCKYETSKTIGGMSKEQFLAEIIRPVVRCARKVTIIDKMVSRAAFGLRNTNWDSFKQTIGMIHGEWEQGLYQGDGIFEVITAHETSARLDGRTVLCHEQAKAIGTKLGLPHSQLRVLLHSPQKFGSDMHDRYLVTSQNIVLGFTKGFDLLSEELLGTCDVYPRMPDDLVRKLMYKDNNDGLLEPCAEGEQTART